MVKYSKTMQVRAIEAWKEYFLILNLQTQPNLSLETILTISK